MLLMLVSAVVCLNEFQKFYFLEYIKIPKMFSVPYHKV